MSSATATPEKKPSYLGLLNAIAVGEGRGARLFTAWADATDDAELARVLRFVAVREQAHAAVFAQRLSDLGYGVRSGDDEDFEERLELATCEDTSDKRKFKKLLGIGKKVRDQDDPLDELFDDHSIDPETGALLGRFIAEERDTLRRLRSAYEALGVTGDEPSEPAPTGDLEDIRARLDRLSLTLEELKALRKA